MVVVVTIGAVTPRRHNHLLQHVLMIRIILKREEEVQVAKGEPQHLSVRRVLEVVKVEGVKDHMKKKKEKEKKMKRKERAENRV
jgi:hypothetical protein